MERKSGLALLVGGLLAFSSSAHAQGYFPFDEIPGLDAEPTVQIDLDPALLGLFGEAAKGARGRSASALAGITNVRVRVYEDIGDGVAGDLLKFVEDTSRTLERDGWKSVVRVNEDGERVRIFMKLAAGGANAGTHRGPHGDGRRHGRRRTKPCSSTSPARFGPSSSVGSPRQIGMNGMFRHECPACKVRPPPTCAHPARTTT